MSIDLSGPIFTDENAAREYLERRRWPDGRMPPLRLARPHHQA
jgi:hypothetical protein